MRMIKKLSLTLAILMVLSVPLSACNGLLPSTKEESDSETTCSQYSSGGATKDSEENNSQISASEDSFVESNVASSSSTDDSATLSSQFSEDSSCEISSEDSSEWYEDSSYSSTYNESSEENSSVDEIDPQHAIVDLAYALGLGESLTERYSLTGTVTAVDDGKKLNVTIVIEGRENSPIYCYDLQGVTSTLAVGDIITVSGTLKNYKGTIEFDTGSLISHEPQTPPVVSGDPYKDVTAHEFYASYTPAISNEDAYYRSLHGFMSGELETPDQAPMLASFQPKDGSVFVRNSTMLFDESGKEYTVVDCYGNEAFKVYRDGAYITLEEVAAFVYAFGTYPANYTTSKDASPMGSIWGEYLRLNHSSFSGNTKKYPYEPKLPNITGCGGTLKYYEMDIGTMGTDCDPSYPIEIYNDGYSITRGAARIVYGKTDLDKDGVYEVGEHHVFYTYNHYNDFQEYLNYAGGWGKMFGNITGGGKLSSTSKYSPTAYVEVTLAPLTSYATIPLSAFYRNYYNQKFAFKSA